MQRIVVFQQQGSGVEKIKAVSQYGRDLEIVSVVNIDEALPPVLDDAERYLPDTIEADLVLDHLRHPDLTHALALRCRDLGIPVVASGRRLMVEGLITPPTCCGLAEAACPGPYGAQFGLPGYRVEVDDAGRLASVEVVRGAPCGASWDAVSRLVGEAPVDAIRQVGLASQLHCKADPSNWDPIYGHSPVHFAGRVHARALHKAFAALGVELPDVDPEPDSEM